jgi:hypothetical protein
VSLRSARKVLYERSEESPDNHQTPILFAPPSPQGEILTGTSCLRGVAALRMQNPRHTTLHLNPSNLDSWFLSIRSSSPSAILSTAVPVPERLERHLSLHNK